MIGSYYFGIDATVEEDKSLDYVYRYMKLIKEGDWPDEYTGEFYVVMSFLYSCELIEFGMSIRKCWLVEKGERCLGDLEEMRETLKGSD